MKCPYCNEELPDAARFCVNCGNPLSPAAPIYGAPAAPVKAEEVRVSPKRWPAVLGILLIIGAVLLAVSVFHQLRLYHMPAKWFLANPETVVNMLLPMLLYILAAVFFFTPTRRAPVVTAIPLMVLAGWNFIYMIIAAVRRNGSISLSATLLFTFFICLSALFYLLIAAIRPRSRALAVIHLVICILGSIAAFSSVFLGGSSVYSLLGMAATLIWYAVYAAAGFMIRPRES